MTNHTHQTSPNVYARIGGLAYLIIIVAGILGEMFIRNTIVVSGDAAATARNIVAHPLQWRIGIAGDLIMHVCDLVVIVVLYLLLKPVNKNLALLAMLFVVIQTAVLVANKLNLLMPLFLLGSADYLAAFDPSQLQSLSYIFIKAHGYGFGIGLIFFGFGCIVYGYLIFRSGYLPRVLGILMQVAGYCYLLNSFSLILAPEFAAVLFPVVLLPPLIAEVSLCLWLIIKGVNIPKWNERAVTSY